MRVLLRNSKAYQLTIGQLYLTSLTSPSYLPSGISNVTPMVMLSKICMTVITLMAMERVMMTLVGYDSYQ